MDKDQILRELKLFSIRTGGGGSWMTEDSEAEVFARLGRIEEEPLTKVQLNQLLAFGHQAPVSDEFFRYYWLTRPAAHPYDLKSISDFEEAYEESSAITSLAHLKWGLYRLFTDGLLWFGNVRTAFLKLRSMTQGELSEFFASRCFQTRLIRDRGPALPLTPIAKDDRYMISEMACKSYGDQPESPGALKNALIHAFRAHRSSGGGRTTVRRLLEGDLVGQQYAERQLEFLFSADDVLEEPIDSEADIEAKYEAAANKFFSAREAALKNTRFYLSMVGDLDVYVATSMRNRQDFRDMAAACQTIFSDPRLKDLQLRYFDPTLSAAAGHEDKGLIECLMVKCAKVLVYCAGDRESYGKDAEAAMALSLGKPVIFYCDSERRHRFYRDVHPLSRLIEFETGVAVGAMVTDELGEVSELLCRLFENRMQYELEQPKPGYLRLKETLTGSVVRLQTNDVMLSETFWNYYHNRPSGIGRE
ncbi:MAG: hypothetical protein ACYTG0_37320 [Planctomycetota bacterium]|jgi:hypothetical protein